MTDETMVEILLVEDNASDAKLTLRSLARVAHNVAHVKDGQAALDYLFCEGEFAGRNRDLGPRLVLLDLKLPKIDGLEVLHTIRNDPRTSSLPVVILTSSRQEKDIAAGYDLKVNSYIVKPVDYPQFADAVNSLGMYWLGVNTPPSPAVRAQLDSPLKRP